MEEEPSAAWDHFSGGTDSRKADSEERTRPGPLSVVFEGELPGTQRFENSVVS